jgi:hypothetical protein
MTDELRKESKRLLSNAVFQQGLDSEVSYLPDHIDATLRSYRKVLKDKLTVPRITILRWCVNNQLNP